MFLSYLCLFSLLNATTTAIRPQDPTEYRPLETDTSSTSSAQSVESSQDPRSMPKLGQKRARATTSTDEDVQRPQDVRKMQQDSTTDTELDYNNMSLYYYQCIDILNKMKEGIEHQKNQAYQALARALKELGNPDEDDTCAAAIQKLETLAAEGEKFIPQQNPKIRELFDRYDQAMITAETRRNDQEIVNICSSLSSLAPITAAKLKGQYFAACGEKEEARQAFAEYEELSNKLSSFVEELINSLIPQE